MNSFVTVVKKSFLRIAKQADEPVKRPGIELVLLGLAILAFGIGVYCRFVNLSFPQHQVFDEQIFVPVAVKMSQHVPNWNDHPALGRLLISFSISIFGNNSFGWRFFSAIFGLFTIILGGYLAGKLFKSRIASYLTLIFLSLDGMFIAYSRTALTDGFLLFFILAAFTFAYCYQKKALPFILITGALAGLAASIKYDGAWILLAITYVLYRRKQLIWILPTIIFAGLIYAGVIIGAELYMHAAHPLKEAWAWQQKSWNFHSSALVAPPNQIWASRWYTWPLMLVPVLPYQYIDSLQTYYTIYVLANPFLLYTGFLLLIILPFYLIVRRTKTRKNEALQQYILLLIAFICLYAPWIFIKRFTLFYAYLLPYSFLLLLMAGILANLWKRSASWRLSVVCFAILAFVIGAYFLPISDAIPLSQQAFKNRVWLNSWVDPSAFNEWP